MPLVGFSMGPSAVAFLDGMPSGKLRAQVTKKARSLIANPHPPGCKKLAGVFFNEEEVWRIRSGDYRILYIVRDNPLHVVVLDIGHRKDVYR